MGALGTVAIIVIVLLVLSVRMAQEYQRAVIFRLGRLKGHRGPGLYLLIPLIERQVTGDDTGTSLLFIDHGKGRVHPVSGESRPLGDLDGGDADERELLDAADDLTVTHRGTVKILERYPQIEWWSAPDAGFADAVNRGLVASRGDIIGIQSSDDFYLRDALRLTIEPMLHDDSLAISTGCAMAA